MNKVMKFLLGYFAAALTVSGVSAQTAQQQGITNTTQILDTSILFAIGAREAEQALRGSFGWPTFQEGFVDRVYFRFDPDGYARFSTSPRLDEDVFEVICAESSTACIAKKPALEIGLNVEGKVQIRIPGINPEDSFFVSDKKTELPLPPSVLEPLDARLETLLASSSHLIVKREVETIQEISLSGFSAVATYLRWVAQRQSPRVFPRGWPVPAQIETHSNGSLTQPNLWATPSVGPQRAETTYSQARRSAIDDIRGYNANQTNSFQSRLQANQATFGIRDANAFTQDQSDLNPVTIESLQSQIAQLHAENAEKTSETNSIQEDFGQSFAQQAQARTLATPAGYTGLEQDQYAGLPRPEYQAALPDVIPSSAANFRALEERVYAIERAYRDLQYNLSTQIAQQIKLEQRHYMAPSETVSPPLKAENTSVNNDPVSELEKLLLDRLSKRDFIQDPATIETSIETDQIQLDERNKVLSLLKQLENDVEAEPSSDMKDVAVGSSQTADSSEEFVTLSDYINQMLKKEDATSSIE